MIIRFLIICILMTSTGLTPMILPKEYAQYDPIHGLPLLASHWLAHLLRHADPEHDVVKLGKELFFLDEQVLLPTKTHNHWGGHLTPQDIADCCIALSSSNKKKELETSIQKALLYPRRQRTLVNRIMRIQESTDFLPNTVQRLLFAYMLLKDLQAAEPGTQLYDYFEQLYARLPALALQQHPSRTTICTYYHQTSPSTPMPVTTVEELIASLEKHPQVLLHSIASWQQNNHPFPPQITEKEIGLPNYPKRPTCVETALLDLVSFLLYNPHTKQYSTLHLAAHQELDHKGSAIILNSTPSNINKYAVHELWCHALWQKPQLFTYRQHDAAYELASYCPQNVLTALNFFFGIQASSWQEVGKLLSGTDQIVCTECQNDTATYVHIDRAGNYGCYKSTLCITPKHTTYTVLNREEIAVAPYGNNVITACMQRYLKQPNDMLFASLAALMPPAITLEALDNKTPNAVLNQIALCADLSNPEHYALLKQKGFLEKTILKK